jgi:hypothetical protein
LDEHQNVVYNICEKNRAKLMLRPTVCLPFLSCLQAPIWSPRPNFYYCQTVAGLLMWGAFSVKRRVCHLESLLVLASAVILGSESLGTHDHILLSQIQDSPNLEGQVPVFISPRNRVAPLNPPALGSLFVACTTPMTTAEVFHPASTRERFSLTLTI